MENKAENLSAEASTIRSNVGGCRRFLINDLIAAQQRALFSS